MPSNLKVLVLDPDYPRDSNLYGDVFVHTRLKAYPQSWNIEVLGYNPALKEACEYTWDGISVHLSPSLETVKQQFAEAQPDIIVVHFIQHEMMDVLLGKQKPILVFFHGIESASWTRRLYDYHRPGAWPYLLSYVRENRVQLRYLRKFLEIANHRADIHFVFVSEWFQKACEEDLGVTIRNKHVIPNSIDTKRFQFHAKSPDLRKKILSIRSFGSRKYANDVTVDTILALSKKAYFDELTFALYGQGYLFKELTRRIAQFRNVQLNNFFVPNEEIPAIHGNHGIFLCFSRLDSQGVSMCEAMSSGLVPITSNVTAIPEFVRHGQTGFLTGSSRDAVQCIEDLIESPDLFTRISKQGSDSISERCGLSRVIPQETALVLHLVNG